MLWFTDAKLGEPEQGSAGRLSLPVFKVGEEATQAAEVGKRPEEQEPPRSGETKGAGQECSPFVLSEALPVVPAKLVRRILKGEYVDMAELLSDNLEMERRRALSEGGEGGPRVGRREVPDLLSWLKCFSLYAAIVASRYPEKTRDLWAYQALMIEEERRCGGKGWRLYDAGFRQQIKSLESADFGRLNQSLYATSFLAYRSVARNCSYCLQADHHSGECALNPAFGRLTARGREPIVERREAGWSTDPAKRRRRGACFAWNDGNCGVASCRFDHVCSRCHGGHRRSACGASGGIRMAV